MTTSTSSRVSLTISARAVAIVVCACLLSVLPTAWSADKTTPVDFESVHLEYPSKWQLSYRDGTAIFATPHGTIELSVATDRQKLQRELRTWLLGHDGDDQKTKREKRWKSVAGAKTWTLTVHRKSAKGDFTRTAVVLPTVGDALAVVKSTVAKRQYPEHRAELTRLLASFQVRNQSGAPTNPFDMLTTSRTQTAPSAQLQLSWKQPREGRLPPNLDALSKEVLQGFVERLNNFFRWRRTMYLEIRECGTANAFYDRRSRTVLFCYDLARAIARAFAYEKKHDVTGLGVRVQKDAFVAWAIEFVLYHEIGHAIISEFRLPIASREEDAADSLALILMDNHVKGAALRGPQSMAVLDHMGHRRANYADTHSFSKTRLYDAACFVFGRRPEEYAYWIRSGWLPQSRAAHCKHEAEQKRAAWYRFFDGITQPWVAQAEKKTVFGQPAAGPER